jgi:hypothetical protein
MGSSEYARLRGAEQARGLAAAAALVFLLWVASALWTSTADGRALVTCGGRLVVKPGVGDASISEIRVSGVSCAQARPAIASFEGHPAARHDLSVHGLRFSCEMTIIRREYGEWRYTCTGGAREYISWKTAYGI